MVPAAVTLFRLSIITLSLGSIDLARAQTDHLIVAGERVGWVRLNMTDLEAYVGSSALGIVLKRMENEGRSFETKTYSDGLTVWFRLGTTVRAIMIVVESDLYHTKNDVRIGSSSRADVLARYGLPLTEKRDGDLAVGYPGIEIWFKNGIVSRFSVIEKWETPLCLSFTFCFGRPANRPN